MRIPPHLLLLCVCAGAFAQTDPFDPQANGRTDGDYRIWTSSVGTVTRAKFKERRGERIVLELADGRLIHVEVASLSQADRDHVKTLPDSGAPTTPPVAATPPPPQAAPPASVTPSGSESAPASPPPPAVARERRIPVDTTIEKIPVLKRKSLQPILYSFHDLVRSKTVNSTELKGKFVYVHTLHFHENMGEVLKQLKLLHDKYARHGFEIITIHPYSYGNNAEVAAQYEDNAVRRLIRRYIADYDIQWYVTFPPKTGTHPLIGRIAERPYFDWLLDEQGRLAHTGVYTAGSVSMSDSLAPRLPLITALEALFPEAK